MLKCGLTNPYSVCSSYSQTEVQEFWFLCLCSSSLLFAAVDLCLRGEHNNVLIHGIDKCEYAEHVFLIIVTQVTFVF